jgi:hypothetical protein
MIPSNEFNFSDQFFYICSDSGCIWRAQVCCTSWSIVITFLGKRSSISSFSLIRSSAPQDYLVISGDMLNGEIVMVDYEMSMIRQMTVLHNYAPITDFVMADVDATGCDSIYMTSGNIDGRIQRMRKGIKASLDSQSWPEFSG